MNFNVRINSHTLFKNLTNPNQTNNKTYKKMTTWLSEMGFKLMHIQKHSKHSKRPLRSKRHGIMLT